MKLSTLLTATATAALFGAAAIAQTPTSVTPASVINGANTGGQGANENDRFDINATIDEECSFLSGSQDDRTFDFNPGTVNGPSSNLEAWFDIANDSVGTFGTFAGCNGTGSTLTLTRRGNFPGLENTNASNADWFDPAVFTDVIYYTVDADFVAYDGSRTLSLGQTDNLVSTNPGAWASAFTLEVTIPAAQQGGLAPIAGDYEGSFWVELRGIL